VRSDKKKILLIGGLGIAAYFLFMKGGATPEPGVDQYVDEPPPPPPVNVPTEAAPLQSYLAIENRRRLIQYSAGNQAYINAFNKMNDQEINDAWEYMWSYLLRNLKLYSTPGATGIYSDGNYNPTLYAAIQAIRTKYKIF